MFEFVRLEEALVARVARLRSEGFSPEEVADLTADEREESGLARSAAFAGTQGRGKPASYGHGKPPKKDGGG